MLQPQRGPDESWRPFGGRFFANVSGAFQVGGSEIARSASFTLYDEPAQFQSLQEIGSGVLVDLGAGYRFGDRLGAGVAYNRSRDTGTAGLSGSLPHPLFFSQPRTFNTTVSGLGRTEQAVHLQAIWWVPFTEAVDFAVSAGPSFFVVQQALARGISFTEVPPQFNTVVIDAVDLGEPQKSGFGFNVGIDGTYMIMSRFGAGFGVGALLRYTRGTVKFDVAEGEQISVTAGGFQAGAGLRVRF